MFEKKGFGSDRRRTTGAAPSGIEHPRGGRLAPVCNVELFFWFLKVCGRSRRGKNPEAIYHPDLNILSLSITHSFMTGIP